jgi:putative Mn2+ efflux pump MntP
MDPIVLVGLAIGLSMDALAVAVAEGAYLKKIHFRGVLRMALAFGGFQGLMPVIGWAAGTTFSRFIMDFDHWIAFAILMYIGGKMIWEELRGKREDAARRSCERMAALLLMALATSIDALAVGLTFAFLNIDIFFPVLVIGGLTFVIAGLGVYFGAWIGRRFEKVIGIVGGVTLMGIGLRILVEHLLTGK